MKLNEQQLINDLLSGEEVVFRQFYHEYSPKVHNFIRKKVGNERDAEEILQDTLFAFLEKVRDFNGTSSLSTYLCAIAHNKIVDHYRKKRIKKVLFSQVPEGFVELFSYIVTPETELEQTFLRERIERVLSRIEPKYRTILLLKYRDGYTVAEIAQKLSCSFKSIESSLFRARKMFRLEFTV